VVVSDPHLGRTPPRPTDAGFHEFLRAVPDLGGHLVINGDLFDFWFEYRRVIPRHAFPTLAALAEIVRRGVGLTVVGGNHDRWGGDFWQRDLGARYSSGGLDVTLGGRRCWLHHGDGLSEQHWRGRLMHTITRHPLTVRAFRALHPDLGFRLVDRLYGSLREEELTPERRRQVVDGQRRYARRLLAERPELDLVVLSHTHTACLEEVEPQRWYLNPGAWNVGQCYALLDADGPKLRSWPDEA